MNHLKAGCFHKDQAGHWCRGDVVCADCCHDRFKEQAKEEHRLGFSAGYAAAVDDLDLHDKFQCRRPVVQSFEIRAATPEAIA